MSFYFDERIDEEKLEKPLNGKITFIRPFIFAIPSTNEEDGEDGFHMFARSFRTTHNVLSEGWHMHLTDNVVEIDSSYREERVFLRNCECFVSYDLFYDNAMRFLFHSSNRVPAVFFPEDVNFQTPDGFMTKFRDAKEERRIKKIVVYVEIIFPTEYCYRPFKDLSSQLCDEYPPNMEDDFRFAFLKQSDYTIKCPDGEMPAIKWGLNVSSAFMKNHFKDSKSNVLIVEHRIDVIQPIIRYLHSLTFEMPKSFTLDFAQRLLNAIEYFKPVNEKQLTRSIHYALCKKFVEETCDFNHLLRWLPISFRLNFSGLENMICTTIAQKYYFKWHQTFPENVSIFL
uniref:Uncharacterized protein n=1 Tax=Panagrolaimus davidi TaxID=227884 RepID=A0A914Q4R6_9BILA